MSRIRLGLGDIALLPVQFPFSFTLTRNSSVTGLWTTKIIWEMDLSPNRNDGELKGGAKWTEKGKVGGALLLVEAEDSYLEFPR